MSGVGEASQPPAVVPRPASRIRRGLQWVVWLALVLLGLAVFGAAGLAWRLAQGPLDITWLARRAETSVFPDDGDAHLTIGAASVAWNGFERGADGGLRLVVHDVRLVDRAGVPGAKLDEGDVSLSLGRLLSGQVVPRLVSLTGLRLRAVRSEDGGVRLELGGLDEGPPAGDAGPSLSDVLAELRKPAGNDQGRGAPGLDGLAQLRHVRMHDAEFLVQDRGAARGWRARIADLDLERQGQGGVKGAVSGEVGTGAAKAALQVKADLLPGGGTHVEATLAPTPFASLAPSSAELAPLDALDAQVQARATLDLSPALRPSGGELHVAAGRGTLSVLGGTLAFEQLALDATARWEDGSWRPSSLTLSRAQAVLPSPRGGWSTTIAASGQVMRQDGRAQATADLTLDHADFADLSGFWPEAWGGHVRPWLVENVTGGSVRDGAVTVKVSAPEEHPEAAELLDARGTMVGNDVTIHWLRPVPPIEHAQAKLVVLGPDVIEISIPSAAQGGVALKDAVVRFTGLTGKDQSMALKGSVLGPVPDVLQVLRNKRLHLLSDHPVPITRSAGTLAGVLTVQMPMKNEVQFQQIAISATGKLSSLLLGGLVAGRDLEHGRIDFAVDQNGMQASGEASVAGFLGTVETGMDFRPGPPSQVQQQASMKGRASAAQLRAANADPAEMIKSGEATISASYFSQRDGNGRVEIKAGLGEAGLALLGWRKAAGRPASAEAVLVLEHDKLAGIRDIDARGPGLDVVARAEMVGGKPRVLRFERIVLGPTRGHGEVRFPETPEQPIRVRLSGPLLDLSTQFEGGSVGGSSSGGKHQAWIADVDFERVLLAKSRPLGEVRAHAEDDGHRLKVLDATSGGPEQVRVVIAPQGQGRRLQVRAEDAGALFHALDITDTIYRGTLAVDAAFDDRLSYSPLSGTLDLRDFGVENAVVVGKLLQAVTIYGIPDAMRGEGVRFTSLLAPFRYDRQQLHIGETRLVSPSLGLTGQGWMDFARKILDVRGTVVPVYAVNSALGRIPLIGRLFSPEKGGGLVAVNYSVTGQLADPRIVVNPLSALTPGFLRRLFNVFD